MEHRCVQCGFRVKSLFVQYSPGNIRLMKCDNCKEVADEYIECELLIILIDLILHKPKAYRHLLYNVFNQDTVNFQHLLWKLVVGYLLLDAYRSLVLTRSEMESGPYESLVSSSIKVLTDVFLGSSVFICSFALSIRIFSNISVRIFRFRGLLLAILISSYFEIFLLAMMVWEFPTSMIFILDLFVLTSNMVALKVITGSTMNRCIAVCITAHSAKFLVHQMPVSRPFTDLNL